MDKIMSAEEFANLIWRCKKTIEENDKDLAFDIRSRDKAIVERIRELYRSDIMACYECGRSDVGPILDRVLRELGGEQ